MDLPVVRKPLPREPKRSRLLLAMSMFLFYYGCCFAKSVLALHIRHFRGNEAAVGRTIAVLSGVALAVRWIAGVAR